MSIFSKFFKKSDEAKEQANPDTETTREKYKAFQNLLTSNNKVLELMADMEEKLSGEYLFDVHYIKTSVRLIGYEVRKIIDNLNQLSEGEFGQFVKIHDDISAEIEKVLEYKMEIPVSDLTLPLESLTSESVGMAGGKNAHLGEVKNRLGLPSPDGFAISSHSFIKFMDHNRLFESIKDRLASLKVDDLEELNRSSKEVCEAVINGDVPHELEEAIRASYERLCRKVGRETMVSVRSSAIREDSEFSFAGQYATFLNVPGDKIIQKYKEVVASLFTPRAIFYSKTKGFSEEEMVMSVGVLSMVDAAAAGVIYTVDPNDPDSGHILINAIHGLGKWVVDGTVTPDSYTVSRQQKGMIIIKAIADQEKMLICGANGELNEVAVPADRRGKQCLSDEQVIKLAEFAIALENHYGIPQDIEWGIDRKGDIFILQSRPLSISSKGSASQICIPTRIKGYNVILDKGVIACKGVGFGKAFILKDEEGLKDFPEGAVLVARHTSPKYVTVMNKASAIITDVGSATGHMASLSREYQIPTILDTEISTGILRDGQEITVDAINCNIYEGKVSELIEYSLKKKEPFKDTHLFKTLQKVLKWVVPLNLTDPESAEFLPEYCKTYHDITRFSHELAMREMFSIGEEQDAHGAVAVDLSAGIPVDVCMLNIEGGLKADIKNKKAVVEDVVSIPFLALLRGMKSMKWPGPPPVDAKGFFGMLAHSASVPEEQLKDTAKKSFAVISENYVNFSIRLGYHFSMIEAYAGENINDNYIKFFFKGGGASIDRRLRRVRLIKEILKEMDFRVKVTEDVMNASLMKYKMSAIEEKLVVMGKLTAYTKQLDMAMFNDAVTDMYIDQFVKEHIRSPKKA
jgi:pyruvate, water dikinase